MTLVVTPAQHAIAESDSAFAVDLYAQLAAAPGSVAVSPYSVASALRMTVYGARGLTADELRRALHLEGIEDIAAASGGIAQRLRQLRDADVELEVSDTIWIQMGLDLQPEFVAALHRGHGATLAHADFKSAPERARQDINRAVADATREHIKDLLAPGAISEQHRLVLTNAVYLRAAWAVPFVEQATRPGTFHRIDGSTVDVPMMHATESYGYARTEEFEAVQLPYATGQLAMTILLPAGPLEALERHLVKAGLRRVVQDTRRTHLELTLPRFQVRTNRVLNRDLEALGVTTAFDPDTADFSGITSNESLIISHIVHESFVNVDEKGTEAAAATAVGMRVVSMPVVTARVVVDRPFLFAITDTATGLPLFVGRVVDPTSN